MKQSIGQKRSAWFRVGVALLSLSTLVWVGIVLPLIIAEPEDAVWMVIAGIIFTAVPIGIGIYGIVHDRKLYKMGEASIMRIEMENSQFIRERERQGHVMKHSRHKVPRVIRIFLGLICIVVALISPILALVFILTEPEQTVGEIIVSIVIFCAPGALFGFIAWMLFPDEWKGGFWALIGGTAFFMVIATLIAFARTGIFPRWSLPLFGIVFIAALLVLTTVYRSERKKDEED